MDKSTNDRKILVTGGTGFIGKALFNRLREEGYAVENFDIALGQDLRNLNDADKAVAGKDIVMHLAAVADLLRSREYPDESMEINIDGTINIAKACVKHNAALFYASTCCVYGNQETHPSSEKSLPNPGEIYACTKLAGEYIVKGYGLRYGLAYNNMRFATIYGPNMRPALAVYALMKQAMLGQPITIHGDGLQTRTFTYIDDLVDGMVAWLKSNTANETVNLSTEEEVSVLQMAQMIKDLTDSDSPITFIGQRHGQTLKEAIDASLAKKLFGWTAKTSFSHGLNKTYQWMKTLSTL